MLSVELSPKTFDLVGMLAGRDYPTETIDVYFNETLGHTISNMRSFVHELRRLGKVDEADKMQGDLTELIKSTEEHKHVVHLEAIPEKVYRAILLKVQEKYPSEVDLIGRVKDNPRADVELTRELWMAYLRKVVDHSGAEVLITESEVDALLEGAPAQAQIQITEAINRLRKSSAEGFEYAAKEVGFLSPALPEG